MSESLYTTQTPGGGLGDLNDLGIAGVGGATATTMVFATNGTVTHVRFFATTTTGGTYTAELWRVDSADSPGVGTLLASKAVAAGAVTAGAWNTIAFDTPVPVTTANAYRPALHNSQGRYVAVGAGFFSAPLVNGNITGIQSGSSPTPPGLGALNNGNFKTDSPAGNYPNGSAGSNSYLVDVVFEPASADVTITDRPGPSAAGGSPAAPAIGVTVADTPGGAAAGGTPAAETGDVLIVDTPGAMLAGGSPSGVATGDPVIIVDTPGPSFAGGSPSRVTIGDATPDGSVWPLLARALACLQDAVAAVESPPRYVSIRPGIAFSAGLSQAEDECCEGSAWIRVVSISPTDNFPNPRSDPSNCAPAALAVVLELGMLRCRAVTSNVDPTRVVTTSQWSETTRLIMNDAAALRRAACCMVDLAGNGVIGTWNPEAVEANCVGGTMQVTIQAPNCDITC